MSMATFRSRRDQLHCSSALVATRSTVTRDFPVLTGTAEQHVQAFDDAPEDALATVAEQRAAFEAWVESTRLRLDPDRGRGLSGERRSDRRPRTSATAPRRRR